MAWWPFFVALALLRFNQHRRFDMSYEFYHRNRFSQHTTKDRQTRTDLSENQSSPYSTRNWVRFVILSPEFSSKLGPFRHLNRGGRPPKLGPFRELLVANWRPSVRPNDSRPSSRVDSIDIRADSNSLKVDRRLSTVDSALKFRRDLRASQP